MSGICRYPWDMKNHSFLPLLAFSLLLQPVFASDTALENPDQGERKVTTIKDGSWSTTEITVHEAMNIGDTTTSYLIVEPKTP